MQRLRIASLYCYSLQFHVVGEILPGLIRPGTVSSYNIKSDDFIEKTDVRSPEGREAGRGLLGDTSVRIG